MATVHELFAEQVKRSPLSIAVSDTDGQLSYDDLNRKSDYLAGVLVQLRVEPESAVAIVMQRSTLMIVSMLAILKAGCTYVPIDENCPVSRLQLILDDAGVKIALTDNANVGRLRDIPVRAIISGIAHQTGEMTCSVAATVPVFASGPLRRAYIMYTSGSTGTPKGVEVVHRGIVRLVMNTNYVEFGPGDVVAQVANPAFDAITFEVWGALLNGARLVVLEPGNILSPQAFARSIENHGITIMFLTSSLFSVMAATVPTAFGKMRTLIVGGDAVNPEAARIVLHTAPPEKLVNGYGPTECTTFSVCHWIQSVPANAKSVPIGRPVANSEAYILDTDLKLVAPGEAGDLYLGGDGLARGYLNRPELTAEQFIQHPFDSSPNARLYKTGDRASYLQDGTIEFLGRRDHQVKFHGFRIELGEVESALRTHPDVIDAAVKVVQASAHNDRLAGYVSTRDSHRLSESGLRSFLEERLPKYMIPSHIVILEQLPLTAVGKIDRSRLSDPVPSRSQASESGAAGRLEIQIIEIWKRVLSLSSVSVEQSFFDVGGTSLTLALVAHQLEEVAGASFEITDLFRYPTIRALAAFLRGSGSAQSGLLLRDAKERANRQRSAFRVRAQPDISRNS